MKNEALPLCVWLVLQDIWAGKIGGRIWRKIGPCKLFSMDLERLRPGEELESEVGCLHLSIIILTLTHCGKNVDIYPFFCCRLSMHTLLVLQKVIQGMHLSLIPSK